MTAEALSAFLQALPDADGNEWCSPPGLGGTWRVKHIRAGMGRQVIVVHSSGWGLAFVIPKDHGVCQGCARSRDSVCEHCNCSMCIWQREVEECSSPKVSRARVLALSAKLRDFQFGRKPVTLND